MKNNKITQICEVMLINLKLSYILNISFACQTFERSEFFYYSQALIVKMTSVIFQFCMLKDAF